MRVIPQTTKRFFFEFNNYRVRNGIMAKLLFVVRYQVVREKVS